MGDEPVAWMVKWTKGKSMYVHCHDDEATARDQARTMRGDITPLYAAQLAPTLRDDFAKAAMAVIPHLGCGADLDMDRFAEATYGLADAMMAARRRK